MESPKPKQPCVALKAAATAAVRILKSYGILFALIAVTLVSGILLNQLSSKNPVLIPHASWCHHSRLFLNQQEKLANATTLVCPKRKKPKTTTPSPLSFLPPPPPPPPLPLTTSTTVATSTTTTTTMMATTTNEESGLVGALEPEYLNVEPEQDAVTTTPVMPLPTSSTTTVSTSVPEWPLLLPQPPNRPIVKKTIDTKLSYIPTMPVGLHAAMITLCFTWPLLPLLLHIKQNNINEAKIESIIAHILGQTTNFGVAELFRTQIALPENLFLDKCNVSPEDCLYLSQEKISLPLYLPPSVLNSTHVEKPLMAFCKGQYYKSTSSSTRHVLNDGIIIYNSLHHFPDAVCLLFGASLVCFITNLCLWRSINPKTKSIRDTTITIRSILAISDIALMATTIFYVYQLAITYDLLQLLGIFVGAILQLMINRTISYASKPRVYGSLQRVARVDLEVGENGTDVELNLFVDPNTQPTHVSTSKPNSPKKSPIVKKSTLC